MALDVKVKIELSKTTGSVGFGIPLLLEAGADKAIGYTECYGLADVAAAGYAETSEMYKAATMLFAQDNRPEKIAVCSVSGTAVEALPSLIAKGWRQLVIVGETSEQVAVADYIETTKDKIFCCGVTAEKWATLKTSVTSKKYNRVFFFVTETAYADAGLVGETAGRAAGSFTYKFKTIKGVTPSDLTDAEIEALHTAGAFGYVTKAGDDVTTEGIVCGGNNKYIDITDSIDYVIANIEHRVQKTLNSNPKVPYDDGGISLIANAVTAALQDAFNNGIIATKEGGAPDFTVSFPMRAATTEADRASRVYNYGSFSFAIAGAIHEVRVNGTITQ